MAKIRIEVCMISARGLPRSSSLWKLHWFAVGWIDPMNNKYCSKVDSSGTTTPTWGTKFSVAVDEEKVDFGGLILQVEVRSREAIFLREKLHGVASIPLRDLVERFDGEDARSLQVTRSFQLRGRKSGEPRGFVDASVAIWEEERAGNNASSLTDDSSLPYTQGRKNTSLWMDDGRSRSISYSNLPPQSSYEEESQSHLPPSMQEQPFIRHRHRVRRTSTSSNTKRRQANPRTTYRPFNVDRSNEQELNDDYTRRPTPPPPPPPSNTGFLPSFFPSTYTTGNQAGFGAAVGAGAFAAGAALFGDDFMSTSGFPS